MLRAPEEGHSKPEPTGPGALRDVPMGDGTIVGNSIPPYPQEEHTAQGRAHSKFQNYWEDDIMV